MLKGERCPYCGAAPELQNGSINTWGPMWICRKCDAYVGCHKGTITPLGRFAKPKLRKMKKLAHEHFDVLWRNGSMSRKDAYAWLSDALQIPPEYTHIGMFGIETCKRVIELVSRKLEQ